MINLEQVKLLESKVAKAIDYIEHLTAENTTLRKRETDLQSRLEANQKRIDELDKIIMQFKEDHGLIESGILAALDKLCQFEEAMEKSLSTGKEKPAAKAHSATQNATPTAAAKAHPHETKKETVSSGDNEKICFEILEPAITGSVISLGDDSSDDVTDPLADTLERDLPDEGDELEIF